MSAFIDDTNGQIHDVELTDIAASGEVVEGEVVRASSDQGDGGSGDSPFPFTLNDLVSWVIKRRDGVCVKYIMGAKSGEPSKGQIIPFGQSGGSASPPVVKTSYSNWCKHDPSPEPLFTVDDKLSLSICDADGTRKAYKEQTYDLIIDAGRVITDAMMDDSILGGNAHDLVEALSPYEYVGNTTDVLRIDWLDRAEPFLHPEFWPRLADLLRGRGKVMTNCQGGHGRSGTAITALMMCYGDYTPLDAITHLRTFHCPRAIESVDQHKYLNEVAKLLKRKEDALEAESVKSFRERFLTGMTHSKTAQAYMTRAKALSKPEVERYGKYDYAH